MTIRHFRLFAGMLPAALLLVSGAAAMAGESTTLPRDTRIPAAAVTLRCAPIDRFSIREDTTLTMAGRPVMGVLTVEMAGSTVAKGDLLRSEAYYIDFDHTRGVQRGPFQLETEFTARGESVSVAIAPLPEGEVMPVPQRGSAEYDALVQEFEQRLALGLLPLDPVSVGDVVYDYRAIGRSAFGMVFGENVRFVSNEMQAELAGVVQRNDRTLAVLAFKGSLVAEAKNVRYRMRASGYMLQDVENCAPGDGVFRLMVTLTTNEDAPLFVIDTVRKVKE